MSHLAESVLIYIQQNENKTSSNTEWNLTIRNPPEWLLLALAPYFEPDMLSIF